MEMKQGRCRALLLVVAVVATLMLALLTCTTAWAKGDGHGSGGETATTTGNYDNHIDVKYAAAVTGGAANQEVTAIADNTIYCEFGDKTYSETVSKNSTNKEFEHSNGNTGIPSTGIPSTATITFTATLDGKNYIIELDSSDTYPVNTKYNGANAEKIGTYFGMEPDEGGYYDISGESVFLISQIVCNGSDVSYYSVTKGGLDLVLSTATILDNATNVIKGTKSLKGETLVDKQFSFKLTQTDENWNPLTGSLAYSETVQNDATGGFSFSALTYTESETYYYTVEEVNGGVSGYTYDTTVYYVTLMVDLTKTSSPITQVVKKGTIENLEVVAAISFENTYTSQPETVSFSVKKAWNDSSNQDGIRPSSVTVKLLADGKDTNKTVTLDADNGWEATFIGLDEKAAGKSIVYTVVELAVSGYTSTVTGDATKGFVITNSHTPETVDVFGTKTWNDADDQDGIRPDSITVTLLADGIKADSCEVTAEGGWKYSFTGLPKYKAGTEIKYTVVEDAVTGYTPTYGVNDFNITNTHTPSKTSVTVSKVWDDADNQDGKRPISVTVKLLADGKDTNKTAVLNEDNNWKATFNDLDEKAAGKSIVYTVEELDVDGYTSSVEQGAEGGYVVTNTHKPATTSVSVTKIWNDNGDQDGVRPESITVNLLANGERVQTATIEADETDRWAHSFTNLPKYANGKEIVYTVTEEAVKGYTTEIKGFTITNTHAPATVDVSGTKTWDDDNDKDGKRPDSIKVNLLANGDVSDSVTVTAAGDWAYSFTDLPKYVNGEEIVYTISEDEVEGYTSKTEGYNIINTLVPEDPEPDPQPSTDPDDGDDEGDSDDPKPLPKADSTPKTGDSTPMAPLALIACAAVALAAFALPAARRRK